MLAFSRFTRFTMLLAAAFACACSTGGLCDAADVTGALAAAAPGDVVRLGGCEIEGAAFTVPAGVALRGRPGTVLVGAGSGPVVAFRDGASLQNVQVEASLGTAIAIEGVDGVLLEGVTVIGPVTADNANGVPPVPDAASTLVHGLLIVEAGSAEEPTTLLDVRVRGAGRFGALMARSEVLWTDGGVRDSLGTGIMAVAGRLSMHQVSLTGMLQGVQPTPSYAGVTVDGALVLSEASTVSDNEGLGLLHQASSVQHTGLQAAGNGDVALWAQQNTDFELSGPTTLLQDNGLAGLVIIEPAGPHAVQDAVIRDTRLAPRVLGEVGAIELGDGIEVIAEDMDLVTIEGVRLAGNARIGALLQVRGGAVRDGALVDVTVDASDEGYGLAAQSTTALIPSGSWDGDVLRLNAALTNDALLGDLLPVLEAVAPMGLPRPD